MLTLHHIGVLVSDLEHAISVYRELFPTISTPVLISAAGVRVCFVNTGSDVAIELIEPVGDDSVVRPLIKRGISYYHLGYFVREFDTVLVKLADLGYRRLNIFRSEAFEQRRCAFLMSPVLHLIEIIETTTSP